jgi:ABC-type transporter Mla subunit MlaD
MKGTYFRVGLLLVVGLAGIVGFALYLTGSRVTDGARYETYFRESVQGLDVGAPVKYRGVTLGQVTQIGLVSAVYLRDEPPDLRRQTLRLVFVRFVIDPTRVGRLPDADSAIRLGLRTRLASQGLTGLAYVELDFNDPVRFPEQEVPWKPLYTYIPSMPSTISQVQDAAQALLAKVNQLDLVRLATGAQTLLDDLHAQLTSGDTHELLAEAKGLLAALRITLDKADLPGVTADLRATLAAVRTAAGGKETRDLLAAASRATERFSDAAAKLPALVATLQATIQRANNGTADLQTDLAPVLRDARAAVQNLRDTTESLRRYPASVLLGGPPPR